MQFITSYNKRYNWKYRTKKERQFTTMTQSCSKYLFVICDYDMFLAFYIYAENGIYLFTNLHGDSHNWIHNKLVDVIRFLFICLGKLYDTVCIFTYAFSHFHYNAAVQ